MLGLMSIRDWPTDERPREKLLARGAAALTDAEILAILLGTGRKGRSALDLAREVLQEFGSLRQLVGADRTRFCASAGLGLARYTQLQAAAELSRRQLSESMRAGPLLASPKATRDFLTAFEDVDVLVAPVTPTPAFKLGEKTDDPVKMYLEDIYSVAASLAGICGVSVPCGETTGGLPIGVQILGSHFGEATMLRVAQAVELRQR